MRTVSNGRAGGAQVASVSAQVELQSHDAIAGLPAQGPVLAGVDRDAFALGALQVPMRVRFSTFFPPWTIAQARGGWTVSAIMRHALRS